MSDTELDSQATCIVCEKAFTPAELDRIVQYGDTLTQEKAVLLGEGWQETEADRLRADKIRITRTAWIRGSAETKWLYDRIYAIIRTTNERIFQFDLQAFSEPFQYAVYHGGEGAHYDWHIDSGLKKAQRKLSLSLQLSDPSEYDGCDLEFHASQQIETAPRDRGTAIVFPSYTLHRVSPITRGTRKSLVVWVYGPKFR